MVDKKKKNPLFYLVIGIVVFIFIGFVLMSAGSFFVANKISKNTSVYNTTKLPKNFPKDFPIYPGAKVFSSISNSQQGKGNGFLITFTTPEGHGLDKVVPFYKSGLNTSGWTVTSSFDSDTVQTWAIAKGSTEGSVSITSQKDGITIEVALGDKE